MSDFIVKVQAVPAGLSCTVEGRLDEKARLPELTSASGAGMIFVNLRGLKSMNSLGVGQWVHWVNTQPPIILQAVPRFFLRQIFMVSSMITPLTRIESFEGTFYCETCDEEKVLQLKSFELFPSKEEILAQIREKNCKEKSCELKPDFDLARIKTLIAK